MRLPPSVWAWSTSVGAIEAVERCLLGTLLTDPSARLECSGLSAGDFSSVTLATIYTAIMEIRKPDAPLVALQLEKWKTALPPGAPGWGTVLSALLDCACCDDDAIKDYVRTIRTASRERRIEARERRFANATA